MWLYQNLETNTMKRCHYGDGRKQCEIMPNELKEPQKTQLSSTAVHVWYGFVITRDKASKG